jgi:hypothetical protein
LLLVELEEQALVVQVQVVPVIKLVVTDLFRLVVAVAAVDQLMSPIQLLELGHTSQPVVVVVLLRVEHQQIVKDTAHQEQAVVLVATL